MHLYDFFKKYPDSSHTETMNESLKYAFYQYVWFLGWINTKANGGDIPYNYFHTLKGSPFGMVEERPVANPPTGTYPVTPNPPFSPYCAWSGDQGLFLNACALLFLYAEDLSEVIEPPPDVGLVKGNLVAWMRNISLGVYYALSSDTTDNVLRESPFDNLFNRLPEDYVCGRGVLARFINEEETRRAFNLINLPLTFFNNTFKETANYIHSSPEEGQDKNQLSARWNPGNDTNAYSIYVERWGEGMTGYSWRKASDVPSDQLPAWNNYCMMMGFDVYGAWLRTSPWWPLSALDGEIGDWKGRIKSRI